MGQNALMSLRFRPSEVCVHSGPHRIRPGRPEPANLPGASNVLYVHRVPGDRFIGFGGTSGAHAKSSMHPAKSAFEIRDRCAVLHRAIFFSDGIHPGPSVTKTDTSSRAGLRDSSSVDSLSISVDGVDGDEDGGTPVTTLGATTCTPTQAQMQWTSTRLRC